MTAARAAGPSEIRVDGEDIYWIETRPQEGGRSTIVRRCASGEVHSILPPPFNVRSRVHEYGGGAYTVRAGTVYFSHYGDGRIYRMDPGALPAPLTLAAKLRYGGLTFDPGRNRILAIREDHRQPGMPVNTLVAVDAMGSGEGEILFSGEDFYGFPCLSPDGKQIVFITWSLPDLPWDASGLWRADLDGSGRPLSCRRVAGGPGEAIFPPRWSPRGELYFVSDRTGWWNIYRLSGEEIEPIWTAEAEFGHPLWSLDASTYAFIPPDLIVAAFCRQGIWRLGVLSPDEGLCREVSTGYTEISGLAGRPGSVVFLAASPRTLPAVVEYHPARDKIEVIRSGPPVPFLSPATGEGEGAGPGLISLPEPIEFPTGERGVAYGFFYPPCHPGFRLPEGELPPLLVVPHSGPTGAVSTGLSLKTQFWTSRGFAVLLLNYRGSTGYGRAYREELEGRWGEVDAQDCLKGAKWLAGQGLIDYRRMAIRGSSAGGFTVLSALARDTLFRTGAVYYGVSDLELLAGDDHKFESGYSERLVGPYPEQRDLYRRRSPVNFVARISSPVIFFQGEDDRVVPPDQTARMVEALRKKKIPAEVIYFPGEGHGFRAGETIRRALEAEYQFYLRYLIDGSSDH